MPLHDRESVRNELEDCVFADRDLTRPAAKYRFPQDGTLPRDAFQLVSDELMLDGNARQNLATFCQRWEEPEVLGSFRQASGHRVHDQGGVGRIQPPVTHPMGGRSCLTLRVNAHHGRDPLPRRR
jgi:glutamate/tyrosine decarboxylase-like PLP-dependent enzyme